jgi:hypothetical protein
MSRCRQLNILIAIVSISLACLAESGPERSEGISIHQLPKRVASLSGHKWGLSVDFSNQLEPEAEQPVLQTVQELVTFVRKQDEKVQRNGVWIVTTNPDAYSESESTLLEQVKAECAKEKIPLFICRASELPNGWKRYDQ